MNYFEVSPMKGVMRFGKKGNQFVEMILEKQKRIGGRDTYISSNPEKFHIEVLIFFLGVNIELACCV